MNGIGKKNNTVVFFEYKFMVRAFQSKYATGVYILAHEVSFLNIRVLWLGYKRKTKSQLMIYYFTKLIMNELGYKVMSSYYGCICFPDYKQVKKGRMIPEHITYALSVSFRL